MTNTPNEVDELRNMIDDIGSAGNDMWHADSLGFYMAKIQAYVTKQQALYHAAGLRELRKNWIRCGVKCLCCDLADEAIAREESK